MEKLRVEVSKQAAEETLKYLIIISDPHILYKVALGLYNFDLVLMVAHQTHRDPKEFLPFLQRLRELPEAERCYEIDYHLGV